MDCCAELFRSYHETLTVTSETTNLPRHNLVWRSVDATLNGLQSTCVCGICSFHQVPEETSLVNAAHISEMRSSLDQNCIANPMFGLSQSNLRFQSQPVDETETLVELAWVEILIWPGS
jgi:hypothetical protein